MQGQIGATMKEDWNRRAQENARWYIASDVKDDEEFTRSGEPDVDFALRGLDPQWLRKARVLEIGCGAGRLTRALANLFGEVHAVDVSGEMIAQARKALAGHPNARVYQNNGCDLTVVPPLVRSESRTAVWAPRWLARIAPAKWKVEFDFAYSNIVFQHIPSRDVIESYVREVHRLLRPGALFKFQVQGYPLDPHDLDPDDTWTGAPFSDADACAMAERNRFEPRHRHGAGTQNFWLWYFKKP